MKLALAYSLLGQCLGNEAVGDISNPDRDAILAAVNAANQEVLQEGHLDQKNTPEAIAIFGPTDLPGIGITQGSKTITGTVGSHWVGVRS